jgi:hypothetical protein
MARFMVICRSSVSAREAIANTTPEQMKSGMGAWMDWAAKAGDAIIDLGSPLALSTRLGPGSSTAGGDDISGYSLMQAASAPDLADVLAGHPHLAQPGCSIDILELLAMPGMG